MAEYEHTNTSATAAGLKSDFLLERLTRFESGYRRISEAFDLAQAAHAQHFRLSGEPYITHPIDVALMLRSRGNDVETTIAGLLHDVEDGGVTVIDIESKMGIGVSSIVKINSQLERASFGANIGISDVPSFEELKTNLNDRRIAELFLCEQISNLRWVQNVNLPDNKLQQTINEALRNYVPLAQSMGLDDLGQEIEFLALILKEDKYVDLRNFYLRARAAYRFPMQTLLLSDFPKFFAELGMLDEPIAQSIRSKDPEIDFTSFVRKVNALEEALADEHAPSVTDLLGGIGPIDLKGAWVWMKYLYSNSQRVIQVSRRLDRGESDEEIVSSDRDVGGLTDSLLIGAVMAYSDMSGRVSKIIKKILGKKS